MAAIVIQKPSHFGGLIRSRMKPEQHQLSLSPRPKPGPDGVGLNEIQATLFELLSLDRSLPTSKKVANLTPDQWRALLDLSHGQHVGPLLYTKLKEKGVAAPAAVVEPLRQGYLLNTGRNLAVYHGFRQLSSQLQAAAIAMIPLKGVYLADAIYPTIGERIMGDLDLLVPKERMAEAIEIGRACHFYPSKPVVLAAWLNSRHQVMAQHNAQLKLTLEWHWHIAKPSLHLPLPVSELWQRAVPATVAEQPVLALAPEDTILHLAYHISYHHDFLFGLRNLCDLALICQTWAELIDWEAVGQRAQAWRCERGVYLVLRLLQTHLAVSMPDSVLGWLKRDDFMIEALKLATEQIVVNPAEVQNISLTRRKVQGAKGVVPKVQALQRALFPSVEQMALRYGVEPGAKSRLGLYLIRWRSLARQMGLRLKRPSPRNTAVAASLKRKKALSAWLFRRD